MSRTNMRRWLLALCLLLVAAPAGAVNLNDTTPWPPDPVPADPGAGGVYIDPYSGNRVLEVTGIANCPNAGNQNSYSTRSTFNYDNTLVLALCNPDFVIYSFNPTAFTVNTTPVSKLPGTSVNPHIWDWSGQAGRQNFLFYTLQASDEASRHFTEFNALTGVSQTVTLMNGQPATHADYAAAIRVAGTVTTGADTSNFTDATIVEPVPGLTTTFFISQRIHWVSCAAASAGNCTATAAGGTADYQISAFTAASGAFVTSIAMAATPQPGDTYYVRPAGPNGQLDVSRDGVWLVASATPQAGGGTQDFSRIFVAFNRQTDTMIVHWLTLAEMSTSQVGLHRSSIEPHAGTTNRSWMDISSGSSSVVWQLDTNTIAASTNTIAHYGVEDGYSFQAAGNTPGGVGPRFASSFGTDALPLWQRPTKQGKVIPVASMHISTMHAASGLSQQALVSTYHGIQATGIVADTCGGAITCYRLDNYLTNSGLSCNNRCLPATPANQGFARVNGATVTYMGTTSASVVANGQWAFDPAGSGGNGQVWVTGPGGEDLTLAANKVEVFDARVNQDELDMIYFGGSFPNFSEIDTQYRIAKSFTRIYAPGASATNASPSANTSRDGRFVSFVQTLGVRAASRRDMFIIDTYRGKAALVTPSGGFGGAQLRPAALVRPASGITASTVVVVPR